MRPAQGNGAGESQEAGRQSPLAVPPAQVVAEQLLVGQESLLGLKRRNLCPQKVANLRNVLVLHAVCSKEKSCTRTEESN